jgi:hypothetical protein
MIYKYYTTKIGMLQHNMLSVGKWQNELYIRGSVLKYIIPHFHLALSPNPIQCISSLGFMPSALLLS